MLHFRSPAVESRPPALDLGPTFLAERGPMAMPEFAVSGLAPSSVVETARGPVLARDLHVGDRVATFDNGLRPVRWVGTSTMMYAGDGEPPHRSPVRIRAGAFGRDADAGNLVLAPDQRVLVRNAVNESLFGTGDVMASAGDLTHLDGVDFVPRSVSRWSHILLDGHEMIRANGFWVESFSPDMWSIRAAYPDQWSAIIEAMPRLRYDSARAGFTETRISLDAREAGLIDRF